MLYRSAYASEGGGTDLFRTSGGRNCIGGGGGMRCCGGEAAATAVDDGAALEELFSATADSQCARSLAFFFFW